MKQEKLDVLVRPFPRAVAGTPTSWSFDADTRRFVLTYRADREVRAPTEVFVPARHFPSGYTVRLTGPAVVTSKENSPLLRLRSRADGDVRLEIVPA